MSSRENQMKAFLLRQRDKSRADDEAYKKQSDSQKPLSSSKASSRPSLASHQPTKRAESNQSTHMISWSVMLDYRTIAIINALEKLYNCKNRDEVIHMLFHHNLRHLINAKGQSGKEHFELYRKVYLLTTKGKAIKRYRKFYKK